MLCYYLLDVFTYISDNANYVPDHIRKIKLVWLVQSPIKHSHKAINNEQEFQIASHYLKLSKKLKIIKWKCKSKEGINPNL